MIKDKKTIRILKNITLQLTYLQNNQELSMVNENQWLDNNFFKLF